MFEKLYHKINVKTEISALPMGVFFTRQRVIEILKERGNEASLAYLFKDHGEFSRRLFRFAKDGTLDVKTGWELIHRQSNRDRSTLDIETVEDWNDPDFAEQKKIYLAEREAYTSLVGETRAHAIGLLVPIPRVFAGYMEEVKTTLKERAPETEIVFQDIDRATENAMGSALIAPSIASDESIEYGRIYYQRRPKSDGNKKRTPFFERKPSFGGVS